MQLISLDTEEKYIMLMNIVSYCTSLYITLLFAGNKNTPSPFAEKQKNTWHFTSLSLSLYIYIYVLLHVHTAVSKISCKVPLLSFGRPMGSPDDHQPTNCDFWPFFNWSHWGICFHQVNPLTKNVIHIDAYFALHHPWMEDKWCVLPWNFFSLLLWCIHDILVGGFNPSEKY